MSIKRKTSAEDEINGIPKHVFSLLEYHEFWEKPISHWGDSKTWNTFFFKKNPTADIWFSHNSLGKELDILILHLDKRTKAYNKAKAMRNGLKNSTENERLNDTSEMVHKSQLNFLRRDEAKKSRNDKQEVEDTNKTNETNIKTIIVDEIGDFGSDSSSNARPAMHTTTSGHEPNENIIDQSQDEENPNNNTIAGDSENNLGEATESMAGKVERIALIVDDIDLEELFEEYCNECKNNFDLCHSDIMDLRPISQFTEKLPEAVWENFVTNTYPEYEISGEWEELIQEFFKPKETLEKWLEAWRGLYTIPDKDKSNGSLAIKDAIYNILTPFIKAFKAPYNILKSGDLGENQYNSQFVSPVLDNTLSAILSIDWRILEVPVESSKHRRNSNINPIIDKVLEAKRADGLARLWQSHEEVFIYEQTGPPDFDDFTQVFIHDYKLVRTMRDILNQRIILRLKDGMSDHKDLASFGAFGHRTEVSLFWCMMHQKSYCLQEYGSFKIPTIWQDLPVLAEAITICLKFFSFMKKNIEKDKLNTDQKNKLFAKRKINTLKQNPPTPNRPKKQNS